MKTSFLSIVLSASLMGMSSAFTANQINNFIRQFQNSRPKLISGANIFNNPNSYQSQAKAKTESDLAGIDATTVAELRQYYTLACIYFATNGRANPRTNSVIPGQPIPPWKAENDDWFSDTNYCTWFGISCFDTLASAAVQQQQEGQKLVKEIDLSETDLTGIWPGEISLISASLIAIDLFGNFFHSCNDYRWMEAMVNMEALFFGTTSWDANGIPVVLRWMTKLQELDFSNTFWRGELTELAFNNLKQLRYLDMGQNFFNIANLDTLPTYISSLPLLSNLYIDNIRATPGSVSGSVTINSISLNFVVNMNNGVEIWVDYTNINGPIPTNIGNVKSIQSLSFVYCKLTGTIPDSIVETALNRLWIYGNPNLTGGYPADFGIKLKFRFLYLEGTGISENVPKDICEQVGTNEDESLLQLGANCNRCPTGCCTCCGDACNNLRSPTPAPSEPPSAGGGGGFGICFPGDSMVEVEGNGFVKMSNLELGDKIKVDDKNTFEPIYSFGHKSTGKAEFVSLHAEGGRTLELSEDHMVALEGGRILPASMVQIGDKLVTASGETAAITTIRTVKRAGMYAPFTESGTVVVNDVVASNYVAFQGSEYLQIAGINTPLNYHWMAHIFNSVHRIAYKMGFASTETYEADGTSTWVSTPRLMGLWLLDQNPLVMVLGLIPYVLTFTVTSMLEAAPWTLALGALTLLVARRNVSVKMLKM